MSVPGFAIAERKIGPGHPAYIIAELSANHGRELANAKALVAAAADAGADAVKLQTYTPETITIDCRTERFRIGGGTPWDGRVLYDLYREAQTPWEWYPELAALATERGLHCFSSVFDDSAVDFLERSGAPAYKIAAFELVDLPLLRKVAATGKPLILSTGMADLDEIDEAVRTVRGAGTAPFALLRTNSGYPASPAEIGLPGIAELARKFEVVTGLSDHTLGIVVPVAAVALGAAIVEKHITLSRAVVGPDSSFSLEPHEFREMVAAVRIAEQALSRNEFGPTERERASRAFRRSLYVVEDMRAGETFTRRSVRSIRPAGGLHTRHLEEVLGRKAKRDVPRGTPLAWELVE